jgi:hypothetical protein
VQIYKDEIWVADAYNHRVQVFSKDGTFKRMIGEDQKMNATTGLFVSDSEVFVTDFENSRVLVFDHQGALLQTIEDKIEKPTDMIIVEDKLYVVNYRNGLLNIFENKPIKQE